MKYLRGKIPKVGGKYEVPEWENPKGGGKHEVPEEEKFPSEDEKFP